MFALEFAALLDGLSIQVALEDPEVDSDVATRLRCGSPSEKLNLSDGLTADVTGHR